MKKIDSNGNEVSIAIEDVHDYIEDLWTFDDNGVRTGSNGDVPYWSDDLKEYVFDADYEGKTYCTVENEYGERNLASTQDQTTPATVTLCPLSFENPQAIEGALGSKEPKKNMAVDQVIPRSATLYHELFHLANKPAATPDALCEFP